mmetsp:Transcript_63865/g.150264  ORF Transcript_63865/g.150264 Transcript_63865/m.150264 type:complete len:314 (+) Transcript_63865:436-1377(+)
MERPTIFRICWGRKELPSTRRQMCSTPPSTTFSPQRNCLTLRRLAPSGLGGPCVVSSEKSVKSQLARFQGMPLVPPVWNMLRIAFMACSPFLESRKVRRCSTTAGSPPSSTLCGIATSAAEGTRYSKTRLTASRAASKRRVEGGRAAPWPAIWPCWWASGPQGAQLSTRTSAGSALLTLSTSPASPPGARGAVPSKTTHCAAALAAPSSGSAELHPTLARSPELASPSRSPVARSARTRSPSTLRPCAFPSASDPMYPSSIASCRVAPAPPPALTLAMCSLRITSGLPGSPPSTSMLSGVRVPLAVLAMLASV